ncbi:hypothetical protein BRD00_01795 [Halobacteriales archaeon QS_8_69_26]|nr:MAG: hypothetical protein BRD00_01795 [Halobacteriales archaeon QS_8_69_26]
MDRRQFLTRGGVTVGAMTGLAGCFGLFGGGRNGPPPRQSQVFEVTEVRNGQLVVPLEDETWVKSRADVQGRVEPASAGLADLSPIGVASAAKGGGRGTGGYSSAPKGRYGHRGLLYARDDDDDWYEDHQDEIRTFGVVVAALGIAYMGSDAQFENNPPGPGPVDWDRTVSNPGGRVTHPVDSEGWYRVGAQLEGESVDHSFGWECIDMEVDRAAGGMEKDEQWKISPRI